MKFKNLFSVLRSDLVLDSWFSTVPHQPTFNLPSVEMGLQILRGLVLTHHFGSSLHIRHDLQTRNYGFQRCCVRKFAIIWIIFKTIYSRRASPGGADLFDRTFYFPTHLRIGVWVVGIMLGYVMYQTRGRRVKIPKAFNIALWGLSLTIIFGIVIAMYWFHQLENNTTSRFGNALFCAILRVGWALGVAWLIFACQNGSGGVIRWFLSLPQWQPMGRMGLSIYLVHRFYQFVTLYNEKQPIYWDFFIQTQKAFGDYVVAIFLGSILYLAVEIPIVIIESYLHDKIKNRIVAKK